MAHEPVEKWHQIEFLEALHAGGAGTVQALHDATTGMLHKQREFNHAMKSFGEALRGATVFGEHNESVQDALSHVAQQVEAALPGMEEQSEKLAITALLSNRFAAHINAHSSFADPLHAFKDAIHAARDAAEKAPPEPEPAPAPESDTPHAAEDDATKAAVVFTQAVQRLENDRVQLLQLVTGDVIHANVQLHAIALQQFTQMHHELEGIGPADVESEVELLHPRVDDPRHDMLATANMRLEALKAKARARAAMAEQEARHRTF